VASQERTTSEVQEWRGRSKRIAEDSVEIGNQESWEERDDGERCHRMGTMHPALTGAIIGVRNENEAREMTTGTNWKLTPDEMSSIQDVLAAWEGSRVPAG
jgi:hypothetical protein